MLPVCISVFFSAWTKLNLTRLCHMLLVRNPTALPHADSCIMIMTMTTKEQTVNTQRSHSYSLQISQQINQSITHRQAKQSTHQAVPYPGTIGLITGGMVFSKATSAAFQVGHVRKLHQVQKTCKSKTVD